MTTTIGFSLTSTTTPSLNLGTKNFTGADGDMQNLLNWAKVAYAGIINELFNPTNSTSFVPTNTQVGVSLSTGTIRAWAAAERKFRQDIANAAVTAASPAGWNG